MSVFHPPEELLLDYATGAISDGAGLAVATHLSMCRQCSTRMEELMAIGGSLLERMEDVALSTKALDNVLAAIDNDAQAAVGWAATSAQSSHASADFFNNSVQQRDLPPPLRPYLPNGLMGCVWKKVGPWFEEARLKVSSTAKVSLLKLNAGSLVPRHTHRGQEITLVLSGGYRDAGVLYGPGDFSVKDTQDNHQPRVDDDEPCLCLVVLDGPVKLTGRFGRFANWFIN